MNDKKASPPSVAILFGGESPEYEVSLRSAAEVANAFFSADCTCLLIGFSKANDIFLFRGAPEEIPTEFDTVHVKRTRLYPARGGFRSESGRIFSPDIIFPVMHGGFGENGALQGLLSYVGLPYVGCGILSSAIASDKRRTKDLLRSFGIPMLPYLPITKDDFSRAAEALGLPFFLKPTTGGSSLGAAIVKSEANFAACYENAARYGEVLAERYIIKGRELEAAVLEQKDGTLVIRTGEVTPSNEFYDYRDKYTKKSALLSLAPPLSDELLEEIRLLSSRIFRALGCRGLARVDFFLSEDMRLYFNEINTLPGMTEDSLYPSLIAKELGTDKSAVYRLLARGAQLPL